MNNNSNDGSLTTPDGNTVRNHGKKGTAGEYLNGKGHTPESVDEILGAPDASYPAANGDNSTGGKVGATVNTKNGDFAVTNNETGEVIAVNDRNNPREEPPRPQEEQ